MNIEIHVIQNFVPANLNRDDTNNPKDCEFGGVRRARISSQCIKRAIRFHPAFQEKTKVEPAIRTRWITRMISEPLQKAGKSQEEIDAICTVFATQYSKMDKDHTAVLLYLSKQEIQDAVASLLKVWDEAVQSLDNGKSPVIEKIAKDLFKVYKERAGAPDIALFGRMVAEKPELNIDAACQVAHAISTHRVNMEMDFFTAADDLGLKEETGAGMMGIVGFNSACFYRYANINWNQLVKNLDNDIDLARRTVEGFLEANIKAIPTGKQNSFAAHNPPSLVLAVVRADNSAWSLANAFEKPVFAGNNGLIHASVTALDQYWGKLQSMFGDKNAVISLLCMDSEGELSNLNTARQPSVQKWVETVLQALPSAR